MEQRRRPGEGGGGTHRSWNLSTRTGSRPAPRGTWGQWRGGTSLRAAGTESHRTCTWGRAGRAESGSHCCCVGSRSGTCAEEERASAAGAGQGALPGLCASPPPCAQGSPEATWNLEPQSYLSPSLPPNSRHIEITDGGHTEPELHSRAQFPPRSATVHSLLRSKASKRTTPCHRDCRSLGFLACSSTMEGNSLSL